MSTKQAVLFEDLQQMDYQAAWDYQEQLLQETVNIKRTALNVQKEAAAVNGAAVDTVHRLLFVEHPPVYTLGKNGHMENVLISDEERAARGIGFFKINRGGDITFHGPGQIVGYPILDLEKFYTDLGKYLRNLEEVIILTLADYGLKGERSAGETGVWMDTAIPEKARKICAIGIRCSRWVTMHGFAFNVNTDLSFFDNIIPCGIQNKQVTSLQKELGYALNLSAVKESVKKNFMKVFEVELTGVGVPVVSSASM